MKQEACVVSSKTQPPLQPCSSPLSLPVDKMWAHGFRELQPQVPPGLSNCKIPTSSFLHTCGSGYTGPRGLAHSPHIVDEGPHWQGPKGMGRLLRAAAKQNFVSTSTLEPLSPHTSGGHHSPAIRPMWSEFRIVSPAFMFSVAMIQCVPVAPSNQSYVC